MKVEFVKSSKDNRQGPPTDKPEYAFIGRSNVGKSSLINMLSGNNRLAKTSQTPGKTQLINHFIAENTWYLVDLPGYGFAKVSKDLRADWEGMISDYLIKRENLLCTFILIDSRLEPQRIDLDFLTWMGKKNLPFCLVFTKTDKLSKPVLETHITRYKEILLEYFEVLPRCFITSAEKKVGAAEIIDFIKVLNKEFVK